MKNFNSIKEKMSSKTKKIIAILSSVAIVLAIILAVAIPTKTDKAVDVICTNLDQFYVPDTFKVRRCIYITKGDVVTATKADAVLYVEYNVDTQAGWVDNDEAWYIIGGENNNELWEVKETTNVSSSYDHDSAKELKTSDINKAISKYCDKAGW